MRMLLRWFALLLCLALAFPAALGESDTEALTALGYQLAQGEIDALLEDATGWSRVMLEDIQLGEVTVSQSSVTVYLTVPSLKATCAPPSPWRTMRPRTTWPRPSRTTWATKPGRS